MVIKDAIGSWGTLLTETLDRGLSGAEVLALHGSQDKHRHPEPGGEEEQQAEGYVDDNLAVCVVLEEPFAIQDESAPVCVVRGARATGVGVDSGIIRARLDLIREEDQREYRYCQQVSALEADKDDEERVVSPANAVVEPRTVVVEPVYAFVAHITVSASRQDDDFALWAQLCRLEFLK